MLTVFLLGPAGTNRAELLERLSSVNLSKSQRVPTLQWLHGFRSRESDNDPVPLIVQVGANDHSKSSSHDPARAAIELGWRALLFEPLPSAFAALQQKYASNPVSTCSSSPYAKRVGYD